MYLDKNKQTKEIKAAFSSSLHLSMLPTGITKYDSFIILDYNW